MAEEAPALSGSALTFEIIEKGDIGTLRELMNCATLQGGSALLRTVARLMVAYEREASAKPSLNSLDGRKHILYQLGRIQGYKEILSLPTAAKERAKLATDE